MATEQEWQQRRNALRQRTLKRGRVFVKGVQTMECLIRNMSLTGARIDVTNPAALPDEFTLFIGDEGMHRECEVMSRTDSSAGLRFTRPLTARELGAEFMSAKTAADYKAERARATAPNGREQVSPPPMAQGGLMKIRPAVLPLALESRLPWANA